MNPPPPKFSHTGANNNNNSNRSRSITAAATASSIQVVGYYNPSATLDFQQRAREKGVIDLTTTATNTGTARGGGVATSTSAAAYRPVNNNPKKRKQEEAEYSLPRGGKRTKHLETTNKATMVQTLETQWSQGTFRWVHKGMYIPNVNIPGDTGGSQSGQLCVLKEFKTGSVYEESFFNDDIRAVEKAAEIIQAFNRESFAAAASPAGNTKKTVHLNRPQVWQDVYPDATGKYKKKLVEPMLEGTFIKFNSNSGYANNGTDYMQALSHFSYHYSNRKYLLCDLQGGHYDDSYVLTDPVIMSSDNSKQFGSGDLGSEGIDNFFAHHTCNDYCSIRSGKFLCKPVQPRASSRIPHTASTSLSLTIGTVKSEAERKQALAGVLLRNQRSAGMN